MHSTWYVTLILIGCDLIRVKKGPITSFDCLSSKNRIWRALGGTALFCGEPQFFMFPELEERLAALELLSPLSLTHTSLCYSTYNKATI